MTRRIRIHTFSTWAQQVEDAAGYLRALPGRNLAPMVIRPDDAALLKKSRIEADWEGEIIRCFSNMTHKDLTFLPARATGSKGLSELARRSPSPDEESWILFIAHQPNIHEKTIAKIFQHLTEHGHRIFLWGFDEVSRRMPCFNNIAPYLSILIHDEVPLEPEGVALLPKSCLTLHSSWLANLVPFANPFYESPEAKITFLGSVNGLSPHRQRQIDFLKETFDEKFIAIHDGSVPVKDRSRFGSWKVHFCPEGRHFTSPGMRYTHTDRAFWSGCMGQVPVIENSVLGGRLQNLVDQGLLFRYPHGNLDALTTACEDALAASDDLRRRIYEHFNQHATIGPVAADLIARYH